MMMGANVLELTPPARSGQAGRRRHDLRVPEARAAAFPRGDPLGWLSGGDERGLRHREALAARRRAGLPRAVRAQGRPPAPVEPLRPARQLRPRDVARIRGARSGRCWRRRTRSCCGGTAGRPGSSSTSRMRRGVHARDRALRRRRAGERRHGRRDRRFAILPSWSRRPPDSRARSSGTRPGRTASRGASSTRPAPTSCSASAPARRSARGSSEPSPGTGTRC